LLLVIFSSVCIRTASVYLYLYLGVCSLFYVLSPVALLPVPPVVVGDLPPLVCRFLVPTCLLSPNSCSPMLLASSSASCFLLFVPVHCLLLLLTPTDFAF
jgi:hypothetical protein